MDLELNRRSFLKNHLSASIIVAWVYTLSRPLPNSIKTLEDARKIAKDEGIKYVYVVNLVSHSTNGACCPKCNKI
jgi:sugar/nucleoside kinase (ribokinase family)